MLPACQRMCSEGHVALTCVCTTFALAAPLAIPTANSRATATTFRWLQELPRQVTDRQKGQVREVFPSSRTCCSGPSGLHA